MTLARTALRLCVSAALKGSAEARPTIAQGRFYDSRIADLAPETYGDDAKATGIILTDGDEGEALSQQNGGAPFHRLIELVIELGMVAAIQDGDDYVVGYPDTDKRLEASLDLLEFQVIRRLSYDPDPLPVLFRTFVRIRKHDCHRQVLDDTGVKIACRILTLTCEVNDDQVIVYNTANDAPSGFDLFPEPLKRVAKAMPAGSSELDICTALAGAIVTLELPPLEGIDFTIASITEDPNDMFDVSTEIRSAMDTPQIVAGGGSVVIDYAKGTFQNLILAANVTALSIINWPRNSKTGRVILKVTNTGSYFIAAAAWPAGTEWVGGSAPTITVGAGSIDLLVLVSGSAGAEIFGNIAGQNYKPPA
jgi:hypothetical protein